MIDKIKFFAYNTSAGSNTLYTRVTELTFKRYNQYRQPRGNRLSWRFFYFGRKFNLNIYIYSDESGVFDKEHNKYFVFGGILFLDRESSDICARKYSKAENDIRKKLHYSKNQELKASFLRNKEKGSLYRALNNYYKFGVIIKQDKVFDSIFKHKKSKQRYLDFAFKMAIKNCFVDLIENDIINPNENINLCFYMDEHTTATNRKYELRELLEEEFKHGTHNFECNKFFPPIFKNLGSVELNFCDSKNKTLIRAADIIANKIYHKCCANKIEDIENKNNLYLKFLP